MNERDTRLNKIGFGDCLGELREDPRFLLSSWWMAAPSGQKGNNNRRSRVKFPMCRGAAGSLGPEFRSSSTLRTHTGSS